MELMVIIPWFLGVKVDEIEFENLGVGCVCKSFPLCFHWCNVGALDKVLEGKTLIVLFGCKYARPRGLNIRMSIHLVKFVIFLVYFVPWFV